MYKNLILFLFISFWFFSCNKSEGHQKINDNNKQSISNIFDVTNKITYTNIKYRTRGTHQDDKFYSEGYYLNQKKEGYWLYFSYDTLLLNKIFFENNKPIFAFVYNYNKNLGLTNLETLEKKYTNNVNVVSSYSLILNRDSLLGEICTKNDNVLLDFSNFYTFECPDSVKHSKDISLKMEFFSYSNFKFKIAFGQFNSNFNFINPENVDTIKLSSNVFDAKIKANRKGLIKIRALIIAYSETHTDGSYSMAVWPFYQNVYVY